MFQSLTVYQLTIAAADIEKRLEPALSARPFTECLPKLPMSQGWVPALGDGTATYTYGANGGILMRLRTDTKEVPGSWVKEQVRQARQRALDADKPFTKGDEIDAKAAALEQALPNTKPTISYTMAYLDKLDKLLYVAATGETAENFTKALGVALGAKPPLVLLGVEADPCDAFTAWVKDPELLGEQFDLGRVGAIKHPGQDGGVGIINIKHEDLHEDDIISLIDAGRQVCTVALEHHLFNFRITADLGLRNIELSDDLKAQGFDEGAGYETLAAKFAAFVPAVREVMGELEALLGGWPDQSVLDLHDTEGGAE